MKAGEVTDVIRTKQGYVILKVTSHQMAGIPPLKDIEPKIQDALYYQELQPALRAYLTKLREDAYIDIKAGYVDSGASPNETKPIDTGYRESGRRQEAEEEKKIWNILIGSLDGVALLSASFGARSGESDLHWREACGCEAYAQTWLFEQLRESHERLLHLRLPSPRK